MAAGPAGIPFGEDVPSGDDIHFGEDVPSGDDVHFGEDVLRKGRLGQRAGVYGEAFWEGDGD